MPKIQSYKDIKVDNLVFSKGEYNGKFKNLDLNYKLNDDNIDLIIQGPKMNIPFGISNFDDASNSYLDLSFGSLSDDLQVFYDLIIGIGKKSKRKRNKWNITTQKFSDNIKNIDSRLYPPTLRVKIPTLNNNYHFNVFDDRRNKLNFESIKPNLFCTPILHIKNVWINETNYGLNIQLLQLKIHTSKILEDYAFLEDDLTVNDKNNFVNTTDSNPPLKDNPTYSEYFKMLRLKIPKESVINKMRMDGHDDFSILDLDENKSLEIQKKNIFKKDLIKSNDLLTGFKKLKKPEPIIKKPEPITSILPGPPSKSDLLSALKKLKPKT